MGCTPKTLIEEIVAGMFGLKGVTVLMSMLSLFSKTKGGGRGIGKVASITSD